MADAAGDENRTPQQHPETPKGQYSVVNQAAAKLEAAWHLLTLELAVAYARGHSYGAKKALKTRLFPGVTRHQLQYALDGQNKRLEGVRYQQDVLTTAEQRRLAEWVMSSARGKDPATNAEISDKVVLMLKARRLDNKQRKHASGCVALTTNEARLVTEADAEVSLVWLSSFQAAHPEVKRQKVRAADATRTKKQNEGTVEKHFHGEYGVAASLKSIGQIDPETGRIKDPRAIIWVDEMPQALNADNQGPRTAAWGVTGEALESSGSVNRETGSVGIAFTLDGFLLGPQFNVARDNFTCALADCLDAPPWAKSFDSQIYDLDQKSTYCLMSKTDSGVQTQKSMLEWLGSVRTQMDAREKVEVAAGRPPLHWPLWVGTDNHSSRFSADVLEACSGAMDKLGIRLFMEEAKTSQFLQPPDQVTKLCHGGYIRGRKEYTKLHKKIYGDEVAIGIIEFVGIWGGCRDMDYWGAWFSWCDAQVLRAAWRKCGWLGCVIAPEEIDRTGFVDRGPSTAAPPLLQERAPPTLLPSIAEALEAAMAVPDSTCAQARSRRRSCR